MHKSLHLGYTAHISALDIYKRILHCRIYESVLIGSQMKPLHLTSAVNNVCRHLTPEAVKNNAPSGGK